MTALTSMEQRIIGTSTPVLEFVLQPGESIQAQGGELSWKSQAIRMRTSSRMAGARGLMGLAKRAAGGGSIFMTEYFADDQAGLLAFATKAPGQILPLELNATKGYLVHRSGFLCGTPEVELSVGFQRSIGAALFGGTGFVLQHIAGDGTAWVELTGDVVTYELDPGEVLEVSPGHVGLFEDSVSVGLTTIPGFKNKLLGGDGVFLVQLTGPGKVWLQSLPLVQLAGALTPYLPSGRETATDRITDAAVDQGVSAGLGLLAAGLGGSTASPLSAMARATVDPSAAVGAARAFLPNGGADVVSSATGTAEALTGATGIALPDVTDGAAQLISNAADTLANASPDVGGSILDAASNLFNLFGNNS